MKINWTRWDGVDASKMLQTWIREKREALEASTLADPPENWMHDGNYVSTFCFSGDRLLLVHAYWDIDNWKTSMYECKVLATGSNYIHNFALKFDRETEEL